MWVSTCQTKIVPSSDWIIPFAGCGFSEHVQKHVVKAPPSLVVCDFEKDEKIRVGEKNEKKKEENHGMYADVCFQNHLC